MVQETKKQSFSHVIEKKLKKRSPVRFDHFIIRRMGYVLEGEAEEQETVRKNAYHLFLHNIQGEKPASLPTIRRWFGIRSFSMPSREQVFRIAFSLELGIKQTEEYLIQGIREPSFQINDYSEMIAMYCLENGQDYRKYEKLVQEYEASLETCQEIVQESKTQWLFRQFESVKQYPEEQFMYWMWEHAGIFKGYSKTTQDYLCKYREQVVEYVREDVKKQLELLLSETGYSTWRKKRFYDSGAKEGEQIKRYIKWDQKLKKRKIPEHLGKSILELTNLAYSENGLNTKLMSELFAVPEKQVPPVNRPSAHMIRSVSGKHLSDLFHIPERNEMRIHTRQAVWKLMELEPEEPCPEDILQVIRRYSRKAVDIKNAGEALEWLEEFDREGKRRRLIVKREDLLPMILYVAQQKYQKECREAGKTYCQSDAQKLFSDLANATMIACNMAMLDEKYLFDMILLECFQEDEMYGYEDVLELA